MYTDCTTDGQKMSKRPANNAPPGTHPDETNAIDLSMLADAVDDIKAPDGLFERIDAAIDAQATVPVGIETVLAGEGDWQKRPHGVWKKVLSTRPDGVQMYLLRCEPGAIIPAHHHAAAEQVFVVEGSFRMGDMIFRSGDAQIAAANTEHPDIHSEDGCLLLIVA